MSSPSIKRQRKARRIDTDGDPEFQVAPMVDVLLVLMLFFMAITSTEVLKKDPTLQLAEADHGKKKEGTQKNEITINISWDKDKKAAQLSMDGRNYPSADSLSAPLAGVHQKNPAAYILIRADKDVEYSNVSDLISICAEAGIATVTFSVLTGGDKAPAAPAAN